MADAKLTLVAKVITDTVSAAALETKINAAIATGIAAGVELNTMEVGPINQVAVSTTITYSCILTYKVFA